MMLTAEELAQATGGRLVASGPAGPVQTDSRRLQSGSWFLALVGDRFDGHEFLPHAQAAQCAGAVVSEMPEGEWSGGLVLVPDTLVALQDAARFVRRDFVGHVVGITGSAGKTTTRAMVADVLSALGTVHQTAGNLNNHIGVPLTLLETPVDADLMVLEMGMSAPGEIELLQDIGAPTHRIVTNVSAAHLQGTGSIEGVARCKQELFDGARPGDVCLVNADDPFISAMPLPDGVREIRYGSRRDVDVRLVQATVDPQTLSTLVEIALPNETLSARIPSPGRHLALNATAAAALGWSLGLSADQIAVGLSRYQPVGMRMRVDSVGGVTVLNDAYNANPASMRAALETLSQLPGRRIALLGEMLELGGEEAAYHEAVIRQVASLNLDLVGLSGPLMAAQAGLARELGVEVVAAKDATELAAKLQGQIHPKDVVLLKGSRGARMERALQCLPGEEA